MKTFLVEAAVMANDDFQTKLMIVESASLISAIASANICLCNALTLPIESMVWSTPYKACCKNKAHFSVITASEITQNAANVLQQCVTLVTIKQLYAINNFKATLERSCLELAA